MMFLDASALVAILGREPEAEAFVARIKAAPASATSPLAIYETVMAVMRMVSVSRHVAERQVRRLLEAMGTEVIPITDEVGRSTRSRVTARDGDTRPSSTWATASPMAPR